MAGLSDIRSKYPEYNYLSDNELADAMHRKFYSDMPREEFDRRVGLPKPNPVDPLRQKAREEVSAYRKANPTWTAIDDTVRNFTRGTPIGTLLDEANAATASVLPKFMGGRSYDEALALQRAKDELADEESTVVGKLPVIGDVTVGGLTKLAGGVTSALLTPMITAFRGTTLAPKVGNAALTGSAYGALYGAGAGEGAADRAVQGVAGGVIGGGIGAVAPLVATGAANTWGAIRNRAAPLAPDVAQYDRGATNRLSSLMKDSNLSRRDITNRTSALGDDAMLADIHGSFRDVTEAIAQQPGRQRQVVQGALAQRGEGAPARIREALNRSLGPADNARRTERVIRQEFNQKAAPYYQEFYKSKIPVDQELVSILQAVPDDVWPRVQRMMRMERLDPSNVANTGQGVDLIKRALDDAARNAGRGTNEERLYSNLSRSLRNHVDNLLSPSNPAASPWARARAISGEGFGGEEALKLGRNVFSGRMDPRQLADDMAGMSEMERALVREAGRSDMRNIMGRAATNFKPNGDAVARRALNSEFNRENARVIVGDEAAKRLLKTINAENEFAETANQVLSNSATARRQAGRDIIPRQYDQSNARSIRNSSVTGFAAEGVMRAINVVFGAAVNERNSRIATDMAKMLVAKGVARDAVIRGLRAEARKQALTGAQRDQLRRVMTDIIRGSAPTAIDGATSRK